MRSQLDCCEDGCRSVGTTDDSQRSCFLNCERSRSHSNQKHCENTELSGTTKQRQFKVTEHRSKVGHCTNAQENKRWKQTSLYQCVVQKVQNTIFVGNFEQVHVHHTPFIVKSQLNFLACNNTQIRTRKVCQQYAETDWNQQKRFIFFYYTKIQQNKRDEQHKQIARIVNKRPDCRHLI